MQRYGLCEKENVCDDTGDYVLYSDAKAIEGELAEALGKVGRYREALEKINDPMTDALSFIKHTAKAALAGKEKWDEST